MKQYYFFDTEKCDMCGDSITNHPVIGQRLNQSQGLNPRKKSGISVSVRKCSNCGLLYPYPLPIPSDIQDHYGIPPESYWKNEYFKWTPSYYSNEIAELRTLLKIETGMKALDVGAGLGKCMLSLEAAGFQAYGFEPSIPFYERAISQMKIPLDRLKLGQIETVDYPIGEFDFITFGAVFEHLYHPGASLRKALGWLKPGGIVHIEVPSSRHLVARFINLFYRLSGTSYVTNISPMHSPFHLYEFSLNSFKKSCLNDHFSIVYHRFDVCDISPIPKFLHPLFRYWMSKTNTGMQLTVYLKKKYPSSGAHE